MAATTGIRPCTATGSPRATKQNELEALVVSRSRDFYLKDRACPLAYEPSGEDFLSPCLAEADLMRRVLPPAEASAWLRGVLPAPALEAAAGVHRDAGLKGVTGEHYEGGHWLGTFAVYLETGRGLAAPGADKEGRQHRGG